MFIYANAKLSLFALFCIMLSIVYSYTKDLPEYIPHSGPMYDWMGNLSQAYLASFIFYILQIYYPKRKNYLKLKSTIIKYKSRLSSFMKDLLNHLNDNKGYFQYTEISTLDGRKQLYIEFIKEHVEIIEACCDKILAYQQYLEDDFIILLNNINNCKYIEAFYNRYRNRDSDIARRSKITDLKEGKTELDELLKKLDRFNL